VGDLVNLGGERLPLPVSRHWAVSLREQLASQEIRDGVDEQHALEQLAVFSLLARWVDAAKVESIGRKTDRLKSHVIAHFQSVLFLPYASRRRGDVVGRSVVVLHLLWKPHDLFRKPFKLSDDRPRDMSQVAQDPRFHAEL